MNVTGVMLRSEPEDFERAIRSPKYVGCPRCTSQDIRISHSKTILDFFVRLFLDRVPFRCCKCRSRFYGQEPQVNTDYFREAAAVTRWTEQLRNRSE